MVALPGRSLCTWRTSLVRFSFVAATSVRIPLSVMETASLNLDQTVDVREEGGRITIEPIQAPTYDLGRLLDAMTPDTFHQDEDFGAPVGGEAW